MKDAALFIAPIHFIRVSEGLGRGDRLDDRTFLTNDPDTVRSLISSRLRKHIGELETESLCRAGLVAYRGFSDDQFPQDPAAIEALLAVQLMNLHQFQKMLWLVKDNAVTVENGFIQSDRPYNVSSRIWSNVCMLSDGRREETRFTRQELKSAREFHRALFSDTDSQTHADLDLVLSREVIGPDQSPLSRALYFVGSARSSAQLGVKIANYCSALEALLVTSPTELVYRLCQRIAWLLGETPEERIDLFRQLKTSYDFRSKAVHGSHASAKKLANDLVPAARKCDELLRAVVGRLCNDATLRSYLLGETTNSNAFEERLLAITLGSPIQSD
jgi:hypothetical protein